MSRASGSKRKAATVQSEENAPPLKKIDSEGNLSATIDREIEKEVASIKSGQHPNLQAHIAALELAKQKKIDAADRHRKLQIKNINALYEYEVEDATALYNKAFAELQEDMIAEVQNERNRQRQALLLESAKTKRNGTIETAATTAGGRSLRSTALATDAPDSAPTAAGSSNAYGREYLYNRSAGSAGGNASVTNGTGGSTSGGTRRRGADKGLDYTLPESTMRSDFVDIVRDLHMRAASLERSKAKMPEREVRLSGDLSEIYIGDEAYTTGDLVVAFSVLSQENIHGIITALTPRDLIIRTPTGARLKVLLGQLRTGRVVLTRDRDTLDNAVIFNKAAEMQACMEKVYRTPY